MSLIPIKLLKNKPAKERLLLLKGETNEYIESRINTNRRAKNLLAIEDDSEMTKLYLHKKRVFEQIAKDIKKESDEDYRFFFRKN